MRKAVGGTAPRFRATATQRHGRSFSRSGSAKNGVRRRRVLVASSKVCASTAGSQLTVKSGRYEVTSAHPIRADFSGWLQPHACVTAVAAQVSPLNGELSDDLLAMQQPDGSWQSYWWFEDAYATAMSVVALVPARSARVRTALGSAVAWARRRLSDENPSPFTLALLLTILSRTNADGTDARRCADALARCRMRDGYWRGSAQLRIPAPGTADPASVTSWNRWWGSGSPFNVFSVDHRSIFTTATAQHALAA